MQLGYRNQSLKSLFRYYDTYTFLKRVWCQEATVEVKGLKKTPKDSLYKGIFNQFVSSISSISPQWTWHEVGPTVVPAEQCPAQGTQRIGEHEPCALQCSGLAKID